MALALYRKYRPRTFAEVIGQEHVTEPLSQALRSGRLHHAYLFSGPRGCGKTSSARILARSLNCEQGPTPEPCGVCISCKSLANDGGGSIDVLEIDAASHGGVDDARELREKAFFAPANSRFKIYVIDEAHMVSSAGFNALLKLVEEPPDYVKFIFATTEPDKVLGTIRSRTHHYPFRLIPSAVLRPYLQQLTEAEGVSVEPAVFPLVTKAGGGSARDSLSVLDQLIAGAGPDGVSYARAVALLGVTDVALIDEMCDALAAGDGAAAYSTIDRVAEAGHDARRFASDLLERLRDLIVLQQVPDAVAKGLIDGPADQLEAMSAQATRLGPATLSRCADIVHNGLIEMRGTTAPRLLLELITARMLLPGAEDSTGSLLQRLERMERRLTLSGDTTPLEVRGEPEPGPPLALPAPVSGAAPAVAAAGGGGLSAARAAARRASGAVAAPRPAVVAAKPVEPDAVSVAAPVSVPPAAAEPDWNEVAGGAAPVSPSPVRAEPSPAAEPVFYDDEPPWDDEPESDQHGPPAGRPAPAVQPAAVQPAAVQPAAVQPAAVQPAAVQPAVVQPAAPVPAAVTAEPAPARSAATDTPVPAAPAQSPVAESAPAAAPAAAARRVEPAGVLPDAPEEPGEVAVAAAIPGQLDVTAVREVWPEIITAIGRQSKKIAALASGATVRDFDGQTVVLTFRFPAHARMVAPEATLISNALYEALGGRWNIRCDVAGEGDAAELAPPASASRPTRSEPGRAEPPRADQSRNESARVDPSRSEPPPRAEPPRAEPPRAEPPRAEPPRNEPPRGAGTRPAQPQAGASQAQATQSSARAPQNRRPEAEAPASAGGDDDWPEPARPGGLPAASSAAPIEVPEDEEWPEVRAVGSGNPTVNAGPADAGHGGSDARHAGGHSASDANAGHSGRAADAGHSGSNAGDGQSSSNARAADVGHSISGVVNEGADNRTLTSSAFGGDAAGPPATAFAGDNSPAVAIGTTDEAARATTAVGAVDTATAIDNGAAPSSDPAAAEATAGSAARTGNGSRNAGPGSGLAAARAAAAGGRAPAVRPGAKPAWPDGSPAEEAPYDPEFDGPPVATADAAAKFEGFDPGDEPLDVVIDEKTARQSSEQQAMQLLRDAFGAEKIGES